MNCGNELISYWESQELVDFYNSWAMFMTRFKDYNAFQSMLPTLLYMRQLDSNMAKRNIFKSVFSPYYNDPKPYVSIIRHYFTCPQQSILTIYGHIHKPFVHALIVGPTQNPLFCYNMTLFRIQDFPVLYLPATHTMQSYFDYNFVNKSIAY